MKKLAQQINFESRDSLDRLAWGGDRRWESYKDKQCVRNGRLVILRDYYVKSKGCR